MAACGGGSAAPIAADGPVRAGVLSGNNQTVSAAPVATNSLPQPVVAQVVRLPSGQVSLRVLDALLPEKAWAQTSVVGVANMVVCARTPDPKHALTAEVVCANSDALGKATFVFHADTMAGTSKAQVAVATATGTQVTDSVKATVLPGPVAELSYGVPAGLDTIASGGTLDLHRCIAFARDQYGNFVAPSSAAAVTSAGLADTTTAFVPAYAVRDGTEGGAITPDATGWKPTIKFNPTGRSIAGNGGTYPSSLYVYLFVGTKQLGMLRVQVK
jgi:hypothetical protein